MWVEVYLPVWNFYLYSSARHCLLWKTNIWSFQKLNNQDPDQLLTRIYLSRLFIVPRKPEKRVKRTKKGNIPEVRNIKMKETRKIRMKDKEGRKNE